jgi:hypothetical protein
VISNVFLDLVGLMLQLGHFYGKRAQLVKRTTYKSFQGPAHSLNALGHLIHVTLNQVERRPTE